MQDYFEHFSQKITNFLRLNAIFFSLEGLLIEFEGKFYLQNLRENGLSDHNTLMIEIEGK